MITGGVVSRTVTVNVFVVVFPTMSIAVTLTVVVPIANVEPDAFEYVKIGGASASVAVAGA